MFPPTLVKYGSPQKARNHSLKAAIDTIIEKSAQMVPAKEPASSRNEDMLDVLLPPMVTEDDGEFWYQKVSRTPATSGDLFRLQEKLDSELLKQEAREIGLCPIRKELYEQCFKELIRQEFVVCPERGRLLRMVYLEKKLSLSAGMGCYESALAYGIQKKLGSKQEVELLKEEMTNLMVKLDELEVTQRETEKKVLEVKKKCDEEESSVQQKCDAEETELTKENEKLLAQVLDWIEVDIHEETSQEKKTT